MPLEMRPRRPIFAQAGNPPAIASSAGPVPTPAGGAPGAVNPQASGQRAPAALTGSAPLGPTSGVTQLGKGQQNNSGALGAGALAGTQPLGGTRATTTGNVGLGSSIPATSQAMAANYGQLGGAVAKSAPAPAAPLSRATGGGGTARTTSARGQTAEEAAQEAQTLRDVGAGRPKDSSLMPVGGAAPKIPGAVSGPGAEPRGGPVGGVRQPGEVASPAPTHTLGYKEGDVEEDTAEGRARTGLFTNGIAPTPVGSTAEGYDIFKNTDGEYWARSQRGWTYMGRNEPNGATQADAPPPGFATSSSGLTGTGGEGRRYSNQGAPPSAGAFGSSSSGLLAGDSGTGGTRSGGQGSQAASGQVGGQASGDQGYSSQAGQLATSTGQDPFLIQALLDINISASAITSEGVTGIEDPDFGISGDAEWNDVHDDEAGKLYAAGQKAAQMRADWSAKQGQRDVDARIEQLLARIGQMQTPGISQQVIQGQVDANRSRLMEEQSRTLGASMTSAAASGLSPEAQQAGGYQMMKDYGIAGAQQEAQTRMSAEMANLQGRQMQYAQQINMLTQLLTLPMLSAQQAMGIQAQLQQLQNNMNAEKEMATWERNQYTGWDALAELPGQVLQLGGRLGAAALGGG